MQNQTSNVTTTVPAPTSTSELCQEYTNAIFYNVGMPLYAVCTCNYGKKNNDREIEREIFNVFNVYLAIHCLTSSSAVSVN